MKRQMSSLFALLTAVLLSVPAFADLLPIPYPPEPEPQPPAEPSIIPILMIALLVIAAAVLVRAIIQKRRAK